MSLQKANHTVAGGGGEAGVVTKGVNGANCLRTFILFPDTSCTIAHEFCLPADNFPYTVKPRASGLMALTDRP
jgi:hypothetical protein